MPLARFSTRAGVALAGDVDFASFLDGIPPGHSVKGMFFARFAEEALPLVASELALPPPGGRYLAFESYPLGDYVRVFDRIARARFPGSAREAYRLLARGEIEVFAASTLGKVTFSMLKDAEVALMRYPELLNMVAKGPSVTAERLARGHVQLTVQELVWSPEYVLGLLEGLSMAFDVLPSVDVLVEPTRRAVFTVRW